MYDSIQGRPDLARNISAVRVGSVSIPAATDAESRTRHPLAFPAIATCSGNVFTRSDVRRGPSTGPTWFKALRKSCGR